MSSKLEVSSLLLTKKTVATHCYVERNALLSIDESIEDFMMDSLRVNLTSHVLQHQIDDMNDSAVVKVPATWWDAFKENAIKWGNPFFDPEKIRYRSITLNTNYKVWATFPECDYDFPKELGKVIIRIDKDSEVNH